MSDVKTAWSAGGRSLTSAAFSNLVRAKLPAYCRLDGMLDRRTGADGTAYGIGFALALPANGTGASCSRAAAD